MVKNLIPIIVLQKKIKEMFVKRFSNKFSEISYPTTYWPEKYFLYLNIQFADEVSFEICFEEISKYFDRSVHDFFCGKWC